MSLHSVGKAGESHHWTGRRHVVVDLGGFKRSGVDAAAFDPDIVILTHSDSDHIGGATGFFDAIRHRPGRELWIPYEWAALAMTAKSLSDDPNRASVSHEVDFAAVTRVRDEAVVHWNAYDDRGTSPADGTEAEASGPSDDLLYDASVEAHVDNLFYRALHPDGPPPTTAIDERALAMAIAGVHETISEAASGEWAPEEQYLRENLSDPTAIAKDISDKSKKLWKILDAARWNGFDIRWFSVDHRSAWPSEPWWTEGEPGDVTMINAAEVEIPTLPPGFGVREMIQLMRMTVQNERALAVYLWGASGRWVRQDGAIIWSDGGGTLCDLTRLPWWNVGVMTGPHHGSEKSAHTAIWEEALAQRPNIDVVLAGGSGNQKRHELFDNLHWQRRRTTQYKDGAYRRYTDVDWSPGRGFGPATGTRPGQ